jgi:hypothetical protein
LGIEIDKLFKSFYKTHKDGMLRLPNPLYPEIIHQKSSINSDKKEKIDSESILPIDILENEANINIYLYLGIFYGKETALRILKKLLGTINMSNFGLAYNWILNGIGSLFPLAADLSFQGYHYKDCSFKDYHPSWRFIKAWEHCLNYKNVDSDKSCIFINKSQEIANEICFKNKWQPPEKELRNIIEDKSDLKLEGLKGIPILIKEVVSMRINSPELLLSLFSYYDLLIHSIPLPFARFRESKYSTFWLGKILYCDNEQRNKLYSNLFTDIFQLWSSREIATSSHSANSFAILIVKENVYLVIGSTIFGNFLRNNIKTKL